MIPVGTAPGRDLVERGAREVLERRDGRRDRLDHLFARRRVVHQDPDHRDHEQQPREQGHQRRVREPARDEPSPALVVGVERS